MFRFRKFLPLVAVLVGAAILGAPTQARADFELNISVTGDATFNKTIIDNGVGDSDSTGGSIVYSGSAGDFTVTVSTALSKPFQGSATSPDMDLNVVVSSGTKTLSNETITISASDTDFGPLAAAGNLTMTTGGTQASGSTFTYTASQDTGNTDFGSTSSSTVGPITGSPFAATGYLSTAAATTYSLTQTVSFAYSNAHGASSADSTLTTPAPAGLLLALTAMPVLGFGAYLRRRRPALAV